MHLKKITPLPDNPINKTLHKVAVLHSRRSGEIRKEIRSGNWIKSNKIIIMMQAILGEILHIKRNLREGGGGGGIVDHARTRLFVYLDCI